ncbi:hypothetical protein WOLCODRAFT_77006 [Wolfiporia cocos MD-104 SS10]|uniref:Uncharacterized protein n=1 Tax=Wolfiporia cocos (strain MD-104) TaxID=742152 RepID=A0A2H3JQ82_WOLCO|nr:hypothetical protein WOLCODRAFT_77006 [Wolfiporia cocos MD-104 SS10]
MAPALAVDLAYIMGFACEAVLWGAYSVLFVTSSFTYANRHAGIRNLNPIVVIAHGTMFILATAHFAIELNHYYVYLTTNGVDGYADETKPLLAADTIMSLLDFVGNCVLIYRCRIIWDKWYIIVLPFLSVLSGFICEMETAHLVLIFSPTTPSPPAVLVPLPLAGYILSLCTNVMVTALIVGRLWYTHLLVRGFAYETRVVPQATVIVVESGLLYLLIQLVYVILFAIQHPAEQLIGIMAVQIYGIAPALIIARAGLGYSEKGPSKSMLSRFKWDPPAIHEEHDFDSSATTVTSEGATKDIEKGGNIQRIRRC